MAQPPCRKCGKVSSSRTASKHHNKNHNKKLKKMAALQNPQLHGSRENSPGSGSQPSPLEEEVMIVAEKVPELLDTEPGMVTVADLVEKEGKKTATTDTPAKATPMTTPMTKVEKMEEATNTTKQNHQQLEPQPKKPIEVTEISEKALIPLDLNEEELKKLAGQTVRKGDREYIILVQGAETGLGGKYWGDQDNLPSRRRSKQPEQLQLGATAEKADTTPWDTSTSRRGGVGINASVETLTQPRKTPTVKHLAKPKSSKKQEEEGEVPEAKQRGRKRKAEKNPKNGGKASSGN